MNVDLLTKMLEEIKEISEFIKSPYGNHPPELSERISLINAHHARLPEVIATLDYMVYEAKARASEELIDKDYPVAIMKIKIEGLCKNEIKAQKFAERLDSACVHQLDGLRSQLSYLKSLND